MHPYIHAKLLTEVNSSDTQDDSRKKKFKKLIVRNLGIVVSLIIGTTLV